MLYLEEEDLHTGALIKVYLNDKFEGYAVLLSQEGEVMTYMHKDIDDIVFAKCRWLIEWVSPESIHDETLTLSQQMSQRFLAGKRTHRYIHYVASRSSWESYAKMNGGLKEDISKLKGTAFYIDDSNDIF